MLLLLPKFEIKHKDIMRKNAFTLLGGILEERLSWKDHMTIITNKVA